MRKRIAADMSRSSGAGIEPALCRSPRRAAAAEATSPFLTGQRLPVFAIRPAAIRK